MSAFASHAATYSMRHDSPALVWRTGGAWMAVTGIVVGLALTDAIIGPLPALSAGIQIYPQDILCVVLGALALVTLLMARRWSVTVIGLLGVTALVGIQLMRGVTAFGLTTAGNESRTIACFLTAAVLFATAPHEHARGALKVLLAYTIALAALAAVRWAILLVNPGWVNWGDVGGGKPIRVINASHSLLLCQSALLAGAWFLARGRATKSALGWILVAGATVVVLQHRSAWFAGAAGLVWLAVRTYAQRPGQWRRGVTVVCILAPIGIAALALAGGLSTDLLASLTEPTDPHSTLAWRISGWNALISELGTVSDWLLGLPFGTGYLRVIEGALREESPHNFFIEALLRLGVVGLLALVVTYGSILVRARRAVRGWSFSTLAAELIVVTQLAFYLVYSPDAVQGMLLGVAAALAACPKSQAQTKAAC